MFSRYVMALQFLTRIPVPFQPEYSPQRMAQAAGYFPLVGATVGALLWAIHWGAAQLWSTPVVVVLVVLADILLTGAFHLDGLADTSDGIFSGRDRARMLEIMRDSRIGTFGALALLANVALKCACLATIPVDSRGVVVLAVPAVARASLVPLMALFPNARAGNGLGAVHAGKVGWREFLLSTVSAAVVAMAAVGAVVGAFSVVMTLVVALMGGGLIARRLGGLTGDTYGAMEEVSAMVLLLAASAFLGQP